MATRRKKNQLTGLLVLAAAIFLGAKYADKVNELIAKVTGKGAES